MIVRIENNAPFPILTYPAWSMRIRCGHGCGAHGTPTYMRAAALALDAE